MAYDFALLREVSAQKPFLDPALQEVIAKNINFVFVKVFSVHYLHERLDLLLVQFIANDRASLRKRVLSFYFSRYDLCIASILNVLSFNEHISCSSLLTCALSFLLLQLIAIKESIGKRGKPAHYMT